MAVGLGIHGEPGIDETDIPTADELAELLVATLLAELPDGDADGCGRAGGPDPQRPRLGEVRGAVRRLPPRRRAARGGRARHRRPARRRTRHELRHGRRLAHPVLARRRARALWDAPADTPAYRRGAVAAAALDRPTSRTSPARRREADDPGRHRGVAGRGRPRPGRAATPRATSSTRTSTSSAASTPSPATATTASACSAASHAAVAAAADAVARGAGAATVLDRAGDAWADRAGGTSGALWGVALARRRRALGDTNAPDAASVAAGVAQARRGIITYGKAESATRRWSTRSSRSPTP